MRWLLECRRKIRIGRHGQSCESQRYPSEFGRGALAVLIVCFAFNMLGRGIGDTFTVFLLPLEKEFGWSRTHLTGVYSIYLLVGGFVSPMVGILFDRLGPRWVYIGGVGLLAGALLAASSIDSLWQCYALVGIAFGVGVGLTGTVSAAALLLRWYRRRLSTTIGLAFSAGGVGVLLVVPLAQHLVSAHGWRLTYKGLGAVVLAVALLSAIFIPWTRFGQGGPLRPSPAAPTSEVLEWTLRGAARTRFYWGLVQSLFFTSMGMYTLLVQAVAYLIEAGFGSLTAASVFGAMGVMSVLSVAISGVAAERFGYSRTAIASFVGTLAGIVLLFLLSFAAWTWLLVAYAFVYGSCQGMRAPIISAIATKHFSGRHVATIYGTIQSTNALGGALGALASGLLLDLTQGYHASLVFAFVAVALAAVPFLVLPDLKRFG